MKWPALNIRAAALAGFLPAGLRSSIEASARFDQEIHSHPEADAEKAWAEVVRIGRETVKSHPAAVDEVIQRLLWGETFK